MPPTTAHTNADTRGMMSRLFTASDLVDILPPRPQTTGRSLDTDIVMQHLRYGSAFMERSVRVHGRTVAVRLESLYFDALDEMCEREDVGIEELAERIERVGGRGCDLEVGLRTLVVSYFRSAPPGGNAPRRTLH